MVFTAMLARSLVKYADRGYRLILLEAGHSMQNLNLAATALNFASVNLGGFFDAELSVTFALDCAKEVPIYASTLRDPAGGLALH